MKEELYENLARRTDGDIYIGVVGPVRVGKSTFVKRVMEEVVIPNMTDATDRFGHRTNFRKVHLAPLS